MADVPETPVWEDGIYQLETTDLVLGGLDGIDNRQAKELANRTAYLKARIESLTEQPLAAIPYPTIATADNRLTVTPASATAGGLVSVGAGTRLTLAEEVIAAATGRLRSFTTGAYTSADLAINSTYYLRAQVDANGDLLLYTQKGADTDPIPAGSLGTPDGSSGGGFDSTVLDMLIARVITGNAGTVPAVVALANAARLTHESDHSHFCFAGLSSGVSASPGGLPNVTLNWARAPLAVMSGKGVVAAPGVAGGWDWGTPAGTDITISRYSVFPGQVQIRNNTSGTLSDVYFYYRLTATA